MTNLPLLFDIECFILPMSHHFASKQDTILRFIIIELKKTFNDPICESRTVEESVERFDQKQQAGYENETRTHESQQRKGSVMWSL